MLAAEVLVEAAQRLTRALDDLLDGEVLARVALVHELERGVEEALDPVLGPRAGRVERSGDGLLPPAHRRLAPRRPRAPARLSSRGKPTPPLGRAGISLCEHQMARGGERSSCRPPSRARPARPTRSDRRFDDGVDGRGAAVGHPRLAPHLDGERHLHERVAEPQELGRVLGQRVERVLVEVVERVGRAAGRPRRRTSASRPWCWPAAWRSARTRCAGTRWRRTARGRRRVRATSSSCLLLRTRSRSRPASRATAGSRPRTGGPSWCRWRSAISWSFSGNFLTVRVSIIDCVASRVLPSCSPYSLNVTTGELVGQPLASRLGRHEVEGRLEDVGVVRRRPVVVREVPVRGPDQDHEVGEEQERVGAPRRMAGRVDRRRLIEVDGAVPRAEQAAAQHPLDRLDHALVLGWRHAAPRRDHRVADRRSCRPAPRSRSPGAWRDSSAVACFACRTGAW